MLEKKASILTHVNDFLFQYKMMGAPEVIAMNALLIKSLAGKKVIDVGVFTGASSLAAALALPDGEA